MTSSLHYEGLCHHWGPHLMSALCPWSLRKTQLRGSALHGPSCGLIPWPQHNDPELLAVTPGVGDRARLVGGWLKRWEERGQLGGQE